MAIVLNGTTGITAPDIDVTAQSTDIVTTGDISAVNATLSGGVYLGGTGAANKLEDYEEGTWTPTMDAGTVTYLNTVYTKIGRLVTLHADITSVSDDTSTTAFGIGGLPFTPTDGTFYTGNVYGEIVDSGFEHLVVHIHGSNDRIYAIAGMGITGFASSLRYADINNGSDFAFRFSLTYQTDA